MGITAACRSPQCPAARARAATSWRRGPAPMVYFVLRLPIFQPQDLRTLTTLGVTAAVRGTRRKMKLL